MIRKLSTLKRKRPRRPSRRLLMFASLIAAALTVTTVALASMVTTYFSGSMLSGNVANTAGFASRDYNRVYRPGGYPFHLGYSADGRTISWVGPDTWDNPYVDTRTATSAEALCNYSGSGGVVSPVTCQTTVPSYAAVKITAAHASGAKPISPSPVRTVSLGTIDALAGLPSAAEAVLASRDDVQREAAAVDWTSASVPNLFLPGAEVGPIRIPLSALGSGDRLIWMYRTDRGKICSGLTDFTAGCLDRLPVGQAINPVAGDPEDGGGTIVWGFAKNDVRAVSVVVDSTLQTATLGRNAFFFQAASQSANPTTVIATLANGTTDSVALTAPSAKTVAAAKAHARR